MNDDIRRRLEEAGGRPAPAPDPAFADALEARLVALATESRPATLSAGAAPVADAAPVPATAPGRRRAGGPRFRLALGGALLAGATGVAVLLAVAAGPGRPPVAPELTAPVNVEVALGDGTVLEDPDGLRLPEGAVVRVGAGGSARVGDTVLEPGDVATVRDGRLQVGHDQPVAVQPGPTATPRPRPDATPSPRPTRAPSPTPTATPGPTPATPAPTATGAPSPLPTPTPARPPATPAPARTVTPTLAPSASPVIVRPRIRARALFAPTRIRVTWTATPGAKGYVLVTTRARAGAAPRPMYPGSRVLGEFARPPEAPLRFRVPDGVTEVKLMVVALRADGSVLARSRIVTLSTVPATTITPTPTPAPSATESPTPAVAD